MECLLKRRIQLFLMGVCPYCEYYHFDSHITMDKKIKYQCHNCGSLNDVVKEIIDGMVD